MLERTNENEEIPYEKRKLPLHNIYNGFYIWFDFEEKKEHYSTPLYLYNVKRDRIDPKNNSHHEDTLSKLIKEIDNKNQKLELHNVYTSDKLTSILFAVLDQVVRYENIQIKTCMNCGRYFIPTYRQNEIYCDLPNVDKSPTCREKGANEQYKKNFENNKTQALYRRIYRQKFMIAQRNKESKTIQKEFTQWKKEAKDKITQMKKNKLTEDEVYNWLVENK